MTELLPSWKQMMCLVFYRIHASFLIFLANDADEIPGEVNETLSEFTFARGGSEDKSMQKR
jgi:hypothetical protein